MTLPREVCVVGRGRTNTPLQALVLLNDVQFVEAARALAQSVAVKHEALDDRITEAYLRLTGRRPAATELETLTKNYHEQRALFASGEQDPARFIELGDSTAESKLVPADLAALAVTCQVILNLDATIYNR